MILLLVLHVSILVHVRGIPGGLLYTHFSAVPTALLHVRSREAREYDRSMLFDCAGQEATGETCRRRLQQI